MNKLIKLFTINEINDIQKNRNFGLDVVRAMAILFVMIFHIKLLLFAVFKVNIPYFFPDGVELFFVLSGYLIGGILIRLFENKENVQFKDLLEFYCMRWFRTLPNYYFMSVFILSLTILFTRKLEIPFSHFIFCQNLFHTKEPLFYSETWSLATEEWFYLLFPILLFIGKRTIFKTNFKFNILTVISLFVFLPLLFRLHFWQTHSVIKYMDFNGLRITVAGKLDTIAYGICAVFIKQYYNEFWVKYKNIFFIIGIIGYIVLTQFLIYNIVQFLLHDNVAKNNTGFFWVTLYPILNSILIAFCLPKVEQLKSIQKHFDKFIVITSVTSYSLYLIGGSFMLVVIIIISKITHLKWYFLVVLFFIITYALAILNYKFFESKFINYRHRFVEKYIRS